MQREGDRVSELERERERERREQAVSVSDFSLHTHAHTRTQLAEGAPGSVRAPGKADLLPGTHWFEMLTDTRTLALLRVSLCNQGVKCGHRPP